MKKEVGYTNIEPPPLAGRVIDETPYGASRLLVANNFKDLLKTGLPTGSPGNP
jgi:hypothetical protein